MSCSRTLWRALKSCSRASWRASTAIVFASWCLFLARAEAQRPGPDESVASEIPTESKGELAGLPVVAGNDTFGFLFGVTGTYTHFDQDYRPFRFRGQLTAVTSMMGSENGLRFPLQNIDLRLDFPGLA